MKDPLFDVPRELNPTFCGWGEDREPIDFLSDPADIRAFAGQTLHMVGGGGKSEERGRALATRQNLKNLYIDGRNVPQPLIDAAGEIKGLERVHLGFVGKRSLLPLADLMRLKSLYLEGAKGPQDLSIRRMSELCSVLISGDADAVGSVLRDGNPSVRYLALGGTESANLQLPDLELLRRFPGVEYLVLLDVSVKSRSLEPCLALRNLRSVIVNFSRNWRRDSIDALRDSGVQVRSRMDEIKAQLD